MWYAITVMHELVEHKRGTTKWMHVADNVSIVLADFCYLFKQRHSMHISIELVAIVFCILDDK